MSQLSSIGRKASGRGVGLDTGYIVSVVAVEARYGVLAVTSNRCGLGAGTYPATPGVQIPRSHPVCLVGVTGTLLLECPGSPLIQAAGVKLFKERA